MIIKIIFGISFIFIMTSIGSMTVFLFKKETLSKSFNQIFLGFASGVMIAASIWSLLIPALDAEIGFPTWIAVSIGFILGGLFLLMLDSVVPHTHLDSSEDEGIKPHKLKRSSKLFLAVTLHNIPEGLAVGLAFGLGLTQDDPVLINAALGLAIGIGLQNLPEGAALALPIKEETNSVKKGFLYGCLSGVVEPLFALVGLVLATSLEGIMPWTLAFAAGAMIYVVVEELIPEAQLGEHSHFGTWSFMIGFVLMMILDVALG